MWCFKFLAFWALTIVPVFTDENVTQDLVTTEESFVILNGTVPVSDSKGSIVDEEKSPVGDENRDSRLIEVAQNIIDTGDNTVDSQNELDTWEAPLDIQQNFVYFHAGFDDEGRPIWMWELGKWNFRIVTDSGPEAIKNFDKFMNQLAHRFLKSLEERSTPDAPVTTFNVLIDLDEFNLLQMAHIPTIQLIIKVLTTLRPIIDKYLNLCIVVNTSAPAQGLITLVRPVMGRIMERVEVYGTNKQNWIPKVLKHFPKKALPNWYGGYETFKPLKIYG